MTIRNVLSFLGITALYITILLFRECQHQKEVDGLIDEVSNYKDTAYFYKLENGKTVAYNQALELENQNQIKAILRKDEDFRLLLEGIKDIDGAGEVRTVFKVKHDTIKMSDTIPCDFEPIKVEKQSPEYSFFGTIKSSDFVIDSLSIPNEMKFVIGEKKTGLFKKESRIEVVNTNPLIETVGIKAYVIEEKAKWGQKVVIFLSGAVVGTVTYYFATN